MSSLHQVNGSGASGPAMLPQLNRFPSSFRFGLSLIGINEEMVQQCQDQMRHCQDRMVEQAEHFKEHQDRIVQHCQNHVVSALNWVQSISANMAQNHKSAQPNIEDGFFTLSNPDIPVQIDDRPDLSMADFVAIENDEDQDVSIDEFVLLERPDPAHDFVEIGEAENNVPEQIDMSIGGIWDFEAVEEDSLIPQLVRLISLLEESKRLLGELDFLENHNVWGLNQLVHNREIGHIKNLLRFNEQEAEGLRNSLRNEHHFSEKFVAEMVRVEADELQALKNIFYST